jgi:glycosyltransferase involved in cell wall biosynthesis
MISRTVVIATCEGAKYIGAQLDSILAQLRPDDEVVVSDDASTDGTLLVVGERHDARIRMLRNTVRVGYVKNFERGIAAARGDYLLLSDQDDIWLPTKVEAVTSALAIKACVASDAIVVDADLRELHGSYFALRGVSEVTVLGTFLKPGIIGATIACRRGYVEALMPFPADVPHDFWISMNAVLDGELAILRQPLILYRRHAAAASVSATGRKRPIGARLRERTRLASALMRRRLGLHFP